MVDDGGQESALLLHLVQGHTEWRRQVAKVVREPRGTEPVRLSMLALRSVHAHLRSSCLKVVRLGGRLSIVAGVAWVSSRACVREAAMARLSSSANPGQRRVGRERERTRPDHAELGAQALGGELGGEEGGLRETPRRQA